MGPGEFELRQRTPVSARARAGELPPGLERYLQTADASLAEPFHIHTVVRTPNGNDYGRDLLRQHHEQFDHARADHRHR